MLSWKKYILAATVIFGSHIVCSAYTQTQYQQAYNTVAKAMQNVLKKSALYSGINYNYNQGFGLLKNYPLKINCIENLSLIRIFCKTEVAFNDDDSVASCLCLSGESLVKLAEMYNDPVGSKPLVIDFKTGENKYERHVFDIFSSNTSTLIGHYFILDTNMVDTNSHTDINSENLSNQDFSYGRYIQGEYNSPLSDDKQFIVPAEYGKDVQHQLTPNGDRYIKLEDIKEKLVQIAKDPKKILVVEKTLRESGVYYRYRFVVYLGTENSRPKPTFFVFVSYVSLGFSGQETQEIYFLEDSRIMTIESKENAEGVDRYEYIRTLDLLEHGLTSKS